MQICTEGIFTYNLDNDTSEQIVDGNMSSLVSPNGNVGFMVPKADGQILLKFNDYTGAFMRKENWWERIRRIRNE